MFSQVEQVLEELRPLIESVGVDAALTDAIDGVATLTLAKSDVNAQPDMDRLRGFIEREILEEIPAVRQVVFEGLAVKTLAKKGSVPSPTVQINAVQPEDSVDTCVFTLDQIVGPVTTVLFESAEEAEEWPLMKALLGLDGVSALMVQDKMIIVTREEGNSWNTVVSACKEVIYAHFGGLVSTDLRARVQKVLDEDINPAVAMHGGLIELLDVKGTEVFVHMGGGCQGCGQAGLTLKHGVQTSIVEAVPEITAVYDTTDHAAGSNPFYRGIF